MEDKGVQLVEQSNPAFTPRLSGSGRALAPSGKAGDEGESGVKPMFEVTTGLADDLADGEKDTAASADCLEKCEASKCGICCAKFFPCMFLSPGAKALPPGQFQFHGVDKERIRFAEKNTCCMTNTNPVRRLGVWIASSSLFDKSIVFLIILNSLFLALSDFTVIDPKTYEPVSRGTRSTAPYTEQSYSWLNHMNEVSESIFTVAFTIEMCLKIFAMGFIWNVGSYLRDGWNWLDFVVVVSGLTTSIPGIPKVSILRAVRVLRPLRSLTAIPKLRVLVNALLTAIPELTNAIIVILFMFIIFSILGLQVYSGRMHFRCRYTEEPRYVHPLNMTMYNYEASLHRGGVPINDPSVAFLASVIAEKTPACGVKVFDMRWLQINSPWVTKRDCVWPIVPSDLRVCNSGSSATASSWQPVYKCLHATYDIGAGDKRVETFCGSNYDWRGNSRFVNMEFMESAAWVDAMNYGFTTFDNIVSSFLTIFQVLTMEGWVDITYHLMDATGWYVTPFIFVLMIVLGSFFLLNLTLAVLGDNFDKMMDLEEKKEEAHANMEALKEEEELEKLERETAENVNLDAADMAEAVDDARDHRAALREVHKCLPPGRTRGYLQRPCVKLYNWWNTPIDRPWKCICSCCGDIEKAKDVKVCSYFITLWFKVATHWAFSGFITACILINTITLALDMYPSPQLLTDTLEIINFILTIIFLLEMIIKTIGLGLRIYVQDAFNVFDAVIVIMSIVELVGAPPSFFVAQDGESSGGALSALRTFRVFRLFKLARSWKSLQELLLAMVRAIKSGIYFVVLLLLFVFIYVLVGQQFFANRMYFHVLTDRHVIMEDLIHMDTSEWMQPRSNFDSFYLSVFVIAQVLSGENWNVVMYDTWRATDGYTAAGYCLSLIILGNFVLLDFFLAILLSDFEKSAEEKRQLMEIEEEEKAFHDQELAIVEADERVRRESLGLAPDAEVEPKVNIAAMLEPVYVKAIEVLTKMKTMAEGVINRGDPVISEVTEAEFLGHQKELTEMLFEYNLPVVLSDPSNASEPWEGMENPSSLVKHLQFRGGGHTDTVVWGGGRSDVASTPRRRDSDPSRKKKTKPPQEVVMAHVDVESLRKRKLEHLLTRQVHKVSFSYRFRYNDPAGLAKLEALRGGDAPQKDAYPYFKIVADITRGFTGPPSARDESSESGPRAISTKESPTSSSTKSYQTYMKTGKRLSSAFTQRHVLYTSDYLIPSRLQRLVAKSDSAGPTEGKVKTSHYSDPLEVQLDLNKILDPNIKILLGENEDDSVQFRFLLYTHSLPIDVGDVSIIGAGSNASSESVRALFDAMDSDGSGMISSKELRAVMQVQSPETTDEEVEAIITQADEDGDGEIDFDEFCRTMETGVTKRARLGRWNLALKVDWRQGDVSQKSISHSKSTAENAGKESKTTGCFMSEPITLKVRTRTPLPAKSPLHATLEVEGLNDSNIMDDSYDSDPERPPPPPPPVFLDPYEGQLTGTSLFCCKATYVPRIWIGRFLTGSLRGCFCVARCFKIRVGQQIKVDVRVDAEQVDVVPARIITKHAESDTFDIFIPMNTNTAQLNDNDDDDDDWEDSSGSSDDTSRSPAAKLLEIETGNSPPAEFVERAKTLRSIGSIASSRNPLGDEKEEEAEQGEVEFYVKRDRINYRGKQIAHALAYLTFDNVVLGCIIASSVLLALESPLDEPGSAPVWTLWSLNLFFNIFFTIEMVLKVIAWGFILGSRAYLRDNWNALDASLVFLSWLTFALSDISALKSLRTLRLLRVLRVLRTINKFPGLKLVVTAMMQSVGPMLNVIPVVLMFFLVFAIVATSYFKGALSACQGPEFEALNEDQIALITHPLLFKDAMAIYGNITLEHPLNFHQNASGWLEGGTPIEGYAGATSHAICTWYGAAWEPVVEQGFDNVIYAMNAFVQMSTTEAWTDIAFACADSKGIDMQPIPSTSFTDGGYWLYFFIAFEFVGAFFLVNLFVGVLIITFSSAKQKAGDNAFMTKSQQEWARRREPAAAMLAPIQEMRRLMPKRKWQVFFFKIVEGKVTSWKIGMEHFVMGCIITNAVVMATRFFGEPTWYGIIIDTLNYIFTAIFTIEAVLKLLAFGIINYFRQLWNLFDFSVLVLTGISMVMTLLNYGSLGSMTTLLRILRIGRIFRLVEKAKSLRIIFTTLIASLPALANVASLVMLIFFIYAVVGVQLFAKVGGYDSANALNEHANFLSFPLATFTLLRMSTGEAWPDMMYDLSRSVDGCEADPVFMKEKCGFTNTFQIQVENPHKGYFPENCLDINGCGTYLSYPYWLSFEITMGFIMLNLIVFYILDSFARTKETENMRQLEPDQREVLIMTWCEFDDNVDGNIGQEELIDFFMLMPSPMGFGPMLKLTQDQKQAIAAERTKTAKLMKCCAKIGCKKEDIAALDGGSNETDEKAGPVFYNEDEDDDDKMVTEEDGPIDPAVDDPFLMRLNRPMIKLEVLALDIPTKEMGRVKVYTIADVAVAIAKRVYDEDESSEEEEEEEEDIDDDEDGWGAHFDDLNKVMVGSYRNSITAMPLHLTASQSATPENIATVFADFAKDGEVDPRELATLLAGLGMGVRSQSEIDELTLRYDSNANGTIDKAEFKTIVTDRLNLLLAAAGVDSGDE